MTMVTIPVSVATTPRQLAPTGAINGVNKTFTLPYTPVNSMVIVWLNGLAQMPSPDATLGPGEDYHLDGDTITLKDAPQSGDILWSYGLEEL